MLITSNLERLRDQITSACARAHRDPATVALMAVSKTHPPEAILEAYAAGQRLFGENRVQEFAAKAPQLTSLLPAPQGSDASSTPCSFHLIGPLQNNKTSKAAELFAAIDTIDSLKTATRLNDAVALLNRQDPTLDKTLSVLIEIKLSPENTKHGLDPADLPTLLTSLTALTNLTVRGLMTVPPFTDDPTLARPFFQHLRRLRDENQPLHPTLTDLSMGMSNDFAVAIEEGSTTIRLGTAIFGKRDYA
jgi:pyridoxal phosphate enzyme (YggS family)